MKYLKAGGAWLVLGTLLLGAPSALALWGVPPSALLGWSIADDGRLLLAAITLMAWIAWVILAGTIVAETVSILTHRALPRVPLLGGLQGMVAGLVVAAIAVSAAPSNAYAAPGHRTTSSPVALLGQGPGPVARDLVAEPPPSTSVNSVAPDRQLLTVRQGDTLSDLAEKHLGDANRWPELYRANRERIDDPDLIQVGWRLILPSSLTDSRPEPATQRPKRRPPAPTGSDVPTPPAKPPGTAPVPQETDQPPSPAPFHSTGAPGPTTAPQPQTADVAWPLVGSVGGVTAALILTALAVRRQAQLRSRPVGRRIAHPSAQARRYETALGRRGRPDVTPLLERALRNLGRHFFEVSRVPRLRLLTIDEEGFVFHWREVPARVPVAFGAEGERWRLTFADAERLPAVSHPVPFPALVTLGTDARGAVHLLDLEERETLSLLGPNGEVRAGVIAAWSVELSCAPWASEVRVTYLGDDGFVPAAGGENLSVSDDVHTVLTELEEEMSARETAFATPADLRLARVNPDLTEATAATVALFANELSPAECDWFLDTVDGSDRGMAVVLGGGPRVATSWTLTPDDPVEGTLSPDELTLTAQCIPAPARQAIADVARATQAPTTVAPWWPDEDTNVRVLPTRPHVDRGIPGLSNAIAPAGQAAGIDPPAGGPASATRTEADTPVGQSPAATAPARAQGSDPERRLTEGTRGLSTALQPSEVVTGWVPRRLAVHEPLLLGTLPAEDGTAALTTDPDEHPLLLLLGPIELTHTRGPEPPRARRQCEEYCGWLLENPGRTATQMAAELVVAEGTRRSNMSRLRSWLGTSASGEAYLPEAYSGRIILNPLVDSDWRHIKVLSGPGLSALQVSTLIAILELVRGAPLADAAPGQWHWAEELRTDMASLLRDTGAVLARRARALDDVDVARWATNRALAAAPEDELLLVEKLRTEQLAGNRREVERLVQRITQQARSLGIDLAPATVRACQEAMEGRIRARA